MKIRFSTCFGLLAASVIAAVVQPSAQPAPRARALLRNKEALATSEVKKLAASDAASGDEFGYAVSISGDTAVVGAWLNGDSAPGSAYVFERDQNGAGQWGLVKKLTASDAAANDFFGFSVAISGDTVVVGAVFDDDAGSASGSAYVFARNQNGADQWGQVKKLTASDAAAGDEFGISVAISGDTVVIGADGNDDAGSLSGSAYIFARNQNGADQWGEVKKLVASDAAARDFFGLSVAISGNTVVVGADSNDDAGSASGSAYVFERNQNGADQWGEVKKLTASDSVAGDFFGGSVAISGDTVVVGAYFDDDAGPDSGSAYVFARHQNGANQWGEVKKLIASDAAGSDDFGISVAISGDTIVVGADTDDDAGSASGSAYVFARHQYGTDQWGEVKKFTASDAAAGDHFGISVAISGDTVAVGAYGNDDVGTDSGSAYVFNVTRPEIGVEQPAGTSLVDGVSSIDFGSVNVGSSSAATIFTITNSGADNLILANITVDGANPGDFTVGALGATNLAPGASTTFTVTFTPGCGARSADLHIVSNDSDENPFDLVLTGTGADVTPPVIVCPPDQILAWLAGSVPAFANPTASDNCATNLALTFVDSELPANCPAVRIFQRTWTATDDSTNSATCSQTITFVDTIPPVIVCAPDATNEWVTGSVPVFANPTASDNCDTNVAVTFVDSELPTNCPAVRIFQRTWTATDDCTNSATCSQTITFVDTTLPVLVCPPDETNEWVTGAVPVFANVTASDNCDTNVTLTFVDSELPANCPAVRIFQRSWTATDDCTNSATCSQTITFVDATPPVIVCAPDETNEWVVGAAPVFASPTANDTCDTNVTLTFVDSELPAPCPAVRIFQRTWTATDDCTNSATCSQTITFVDTTPPVIVCAPDGTNEWVTGSVIASPTASDNCDTNLAITFVDSELPADCPAVRIIQRTWTAMDDCTNSATCSQTITFVDTTPPVIVCAPDETNEWVAGSVPVFANPTTSDSCDTNVTLTFVDSELPANCPAVRIFQRTWTATDDCTNSATCSQTLTFVDTTPPVIACPADLSTNSPTGVISLIVNYATATATDACDTNPAVGCSPPSGSIFPLGATTVSCTATDACNNTSACSFVITATSPPLLLNVVAEWKLDDLAGNRVTNAAANALHGTLRNGPMWIATGRLGGALIFDGLNDFVDVPDASQLEFNATSFSVALWVRTTNTTAQALVEKQHSEFTGMFLFALNRDNLASTRGGFMVWTGGTWIDSNFKGLLDGQWHHVAVTFDGTRFRLYRDGMLDRTASSTASYANTAGPLNIGRFGTVNQGWPFRGMMDDIVKCNRVLAPAEITALADAPASPTVLGGPGSGPRTLDRIHLTLTRAGDGTVTLTGQGAPRRAYGIEATANFEQWIRFSAAEGDETGRFEVTDPTAGEYLDPILPAGDSLKPWRE